MNDPVHISGEGVLPESVHGQIASALIGEAAAGLPDEVDYSAFEADDRRFAWLHNPASLETDGPQFLVLELRPSGDDWEVLDVDAYDSPEDAMQAAGRAWLKETGGPEVPTEPVADW